MTDRDAIGYATYRSLSRSDVKIRRHTPAADPAADAQIHRRTTPKFAGITKRLEDGDGNPTRLVYYAGGKFDFTLLAAEELGSVFTSGRSWCCSIRTEPPAPPRTGR